MPQRRDELLRFQDLSADRAVESFRAARFRTRRRYRGHDDLRVPQRRDGFPLLQNHAADRAVAPLAQPRFRAGRSQYRVRDLRVAQGLPFRLAAFGAPGRLCTGGRLHVVTDAAAGQQHHHQCHHGDRQNKAFHGSFSFPRFPNLML